MTLWISHQLILAIHDEQLREHGGGGGLRDQGLLESALARPLNRAGYGEPDIAELAALYALGIARNHPFVDGNKRTAFGAMVTFLSLNGMELEALESEAYLAALAMASGEMPEKDFIAWVRAHAVPA